jgi:hypothetical protein
MLRNIIILCALLMTLACSQYRNEKWNIRVFSGGKLIYAGSNVMFTGQGSANCYYFKANTMESPLTIVCGDIVAERIGD